ncbi:antitoxin [Fusobacterium sp. PH5-44]|uniref:antitoxin n=1 Tax=unclassified Fusobacterium TaxID=2648384 RepID=UPI003D1E7DED
MDNVIMTVGTGMIDYFVQNNPNIKEISEKKVLEYYTKEINELPENSLLLREIIAIRTLIQKKIFTGKRIFLLSHDTVNGKIAVNVLENLFKKFKIAKKVDKRIILKLDKRNYSNFTNIGIRNLIDEINQIVKKEIGNRVNVCICPVGGYRVEIFLVGLMAQLLHIKSYFMFDEFDNISEISPFPIRIDYNFYWEHSEFFEIFEKNEYVSHKKVEKYLEATSRLHYLIEEVNINGKKMLGLSALGEYYAKLSTDESNLPASRSACLPIDKEVIYRTESIPELETIINSLKSSPYVDKLVYVYFNPDRKCTSSRFYIVNNSKNDQIITLEYACENGVAGIDIYTLGSTEKELRSLVAYFNANFIH